MKYRHLGRAGIQVSELSLGSWITFNNQLDVDAAMACMSVAYEAGANFFDNAEAYARGKSEEVMGMALRKLGWRRGSYLVSTKVYWGLHGGPNEGHTLNRKRVIEAINGSLERLQLDYVDLYFCHRPDSTTPIEETVWAMHNVIEWGKALYWGTSQWSSGEIAAAIEIAERHHLHKPVTEQPEYNMFERDRFEKQYARIFRDYRYGSTTWSPLASGLLTGKYNEGIPTGSRGALKSMSWLQDELTDEQKLAKVRALEPIALELGCTLAQLALAWILKNPNVSTVITGASRPEQVRENMGAADVVDKLTPEVMERIESVLGNRPVEDEDD
jgi:voltage-dependent potassium channel beta subunit